MLRLFSRKDTPQEKGKGKKRGQEPKIDAGRESRALSESEEYIAVDTRIFSAGRGWAFVYDQEKGNVCRLSSMVASLIPSLSRFRTAREHLSHLVRQHVAVKSTRMIEEAFLQLHAAGLLRSRSHLFSAIAKQQPKPNGTISTIVWPSLDRSESLKRSIESYISHNRKYGRDVRYLVVNNSFSKKASDNYQQMLATIAANEDQPINYCGVVEIRDFIREMVQKGKGDGLPQKLMEFALLGKEENSSARCGVARNAILLATEGEMILSTDDDTLCRFAEPPVAEKGIELSSEFDPAEIRFFPNRQAVLEKVKFRDVDIFAEHESMLGRSLADCISLQQPEDFLVTADMSPRFAYFANDRKGRIALTQTGVCGDSAMGSAKVVIKLEGQARKLALGTKDVYDSSITSKEILSGVKRKTISEGAFFMTANAGIDNRRLLPPFFTIGRNAEGIFALILRACFENAFIGFLPLGVYHDPPEPRRLVPEMMPHFAPRVEEVLILLIQFFRHPAGCETSTQRLQGLGQHLKELAALPLHEFEGYVRYLWMVNQSSYIRFLDEQLKKHRASPEYWARDIVALKDSVRAFLASGRICVPQNEHEQLPQETVAKWVQLTVGQFGELLYWWPCIVNLSRELNEEGKGLAVHV